MTRNDRERGATGYVLDSNKLAQAIRDAVKPDASADDFPPLQSVLVFGEGTKWAIVNYEGVGNFADDYDAKPHAYYCYKGGFQIESVPLTWDVVTECRDMTEPPVDLADFIRTFGDRLDNNHAIWYRFADKESAMA